MKRRLLAAAAVLSLLVLLGGGLALYVLRSDALRERIRARIVLELEKATGAKAELARFDFEWFGWRVRVEGLVLHGKEAANQRPYVSIPSAELKLTVRSWFSRDVVLDRLSVDKPEVHIYVDAEGHTNIPSPAKPSGADPVASLLKLKIRQLRIAGGIFEYDSRRVPLNIEARDLDAALDWEAGPQYRTRLTVGALRLPVVEEAQLEGDVLLRAGELKFESVRLRRKQSSVEAKGSMSSFRSPVFDVDFTGTIRPADIPDSPLHQGQAKVSGKFAYPAEGGWRIDGNVEASGLGYRAEKARINGVGVAGPFSVTSSRLWLSGARVTALGGVWQGAATLTAWESFELEGVLDRMPSARAWAVANDEPLPWSGVLTGPLRASGRIAGGGVEGMKVSGSLRVEPEPGQIPVTGEIAASWSQAGNRVDLDTSHFAINNTRVHFRGVLGDDLEVSLISSSLQDLDGVIQTLTKDPKFDLPLDLAQGEATAKVRVSGPIDRPRINGQFDLRNLVYRGVTIDRIESDVALSETGLTLGRIRAARGQTTLRGDLRIPLERWQISFTAPVAAKLELRNADAAELQQLAGLPPRFKMKFGGNLELSGSLEDPSASLRFDGTQLQAAGETFEKTAGSFVLRSGSGGDAVVAGEWLLGSARGTVDGSFRHPKRDWENGAGSVKFTEKGLELASLQAVRSVRSGLAGVLSLDGNLSFRLQEGQPRLDRIFAVARSDNLTLDTEPVGSFRVEANTVGEAIGLSNTLVLEGRRITGSSLVQLDADYNAEGVLRIPRLPFSLIRRVLDEPDPGKGREPLPVQGFVEGEVVWKAPLAAPSRGSADLTVSRLQVRPRAEALPESEIDTSELVVRNSGPLRLSVDAKAIRIRSARLQALNTDLTVAGLYRFGATNPWELTLNGDADLALLSNFQPNIVANGTASIDASLRGASADPLFGGKMRISNASFFLRDFPNGIDKAEGAVTFERNRVNIQKLTGRTGGGQFEVSGFLGLNQNEVSYRLQARAANVRVRYPEGVSTTFDADLSLTGSSTRSLLAGNILVQRTGFNPRADFASTVGSAGAPIPAPVGQNEFLRNLLFDIRIRSAPNATIQSSYTQDLSAEADLRLRGSPSKPILLGSVKASQGDVNFFGNRYTVSRGEILFYNVASIQPAVDLNLETRIRGVTVFISVSGPLSKLNVSYRSEPPLLSTDIFALLTVGRAPTAMGTSLPSTSDPNRAAIPGGSSNSLLGVALSSAVSSRVEKFFGKSRIKIDPQMTGVENVPQARLTIEQSISRDVTLTLVTNLSRAQQQLVRLEWDLSREWQLIVVRDENGVFGADFAYRKRFK